ncbi:MAG: alpha/beta fold hydrolase [Propionibacteriales bacterium]|nr:alpha/beta fold hydrolase [Propionibacteriales bacterium]
MPDARVEAAIEHWGPRMIQNGVDYNDFVRTTARTHTWADWLPEWNRTADEHAERAAREEDDGHPLTAGQAWRSAAVDRHFGKFVWTLDADLAADATRRSVQEMGNALRLLDPTAERLTAEVDGAPLAANLRRPPGAERPPLVVLVPGLDSTKEEFFFLEQAFLDRGMATVSVDGPGQGETGVRLPIRHDYETGIAPLLDVVTARADLDPERIGLVGVSLGGYYAPRVAAYEPRVRAAVGISGPYRWVDLWDDLPQLTRDTFTVKSGGGSDDDGRARAAALDLTGVCERIEVPALYVTGALDRLIPWQQTQAQADHTPMGEFVCYPEGNHGASNLPSVARPMIADWMADHLAGR